MFYYNFRLINVYLAKYASSSSQPQLANLDMFASGIRNHYFISC